MGNCLDRSMSSSSEDSEETLAESGAHRQRRRTRGSGPNRYVQLVDSSHSFSPSLMNPSRMFMARRERSFNSFSGTGASQSTEEAALSSSLPNQPFNLASTQQVYYLSPHIQRTADQLTEEDQIKLLKRKALIDQLPCGDYDENKKHKECAICMIDFEIKDRIKYLPCMHTFHESCIDAWLIRSLMCPCCMEPVDAGLLSAFE
ncbi:RING finger 11 [Brachionus plicatilis]|uniref:RING finger 11 n=1 Tax=Brachionus plicatilis TaxID=10195 RepID=A0A3M7S815_BRAPC|nr:RING finger 11 [Brachionus plicatilis]